MVSACDSNATAICVGKRAANEVSDLSVNELLGVIGATFAGEDGSGFFGLSANDSPDPNFTLGDGTTCLTPTTGPCAYGHASPL